MNDNEYDKRQMKFGGESSRKRSLLQILFIDMRAISLPKKIATRKDTRRDNNQSLSDRLIRHSN